MDVPASSTIRLNGYRPFLQAAVTLIVASLSTAHAGSNETLKTAVRNNYREINALAQQGQLSVKLRKCSGTAAEFSLMTDRTGVIRRYVLTAGSDDSALNVQHDYDRNGKLTFVLATYGNVHGGKYEWRLYYTPSGRVFDVARSTGTAPFNEALLFQYVTPNPAADWNSTWCPSV